MRCQSHRSVSLTACWIFFGMLMASLLAANPALGVPANEGAGRTLSQPDGSVFEARLFGDEWAHWYETADGYTVAQDASGRWTYAIEDADGELAPSSTAVGQGAPPAEAHLRQDGAILSKVLERRRDAAAEAGVLTAITGTARVVIILAQFTDTPSGEGATGAHTPAYFADPTSGIVLGSDPGKMKNYYSEVSYNQLAVQGEVANSQWHTIAHTEAYYGGDCSPGVTCSGQSGPSTGNDNCNVCIYELARAAVQAADAAGFNFAPYDTDADGVIDHVMIVHAGQNQASLGGAPSDIWSHRWSIPGAGQTVDGKVIRGYVMVSENDAMSVFAHEFAHDLGAPDLYDYGHESDPFGKWCLMSFNFESERPAHLCGLLKIDLDGNVNNGMTGWATPTLLTASGTFTVGRLDQNATGSVYLTDPVFSGKERFIVENRARGGFYDYSLPESGILFTHLDADMPNSSGRFNDGPPLNTYFGAWLERPLNLASADGAAYSADDGQTRFDPTSVPNTDANGGVGTGKVFRNVGAESASMSFEYRNGPTNVSGSTTGDTHWSRDGSPYVVQSNFTVSDGNTLTIDPGVIVKFQSGVGMTVNGTLQAVAAIGDTIAFTSIRDDHWGGDTNQDGPSVGATGQWTGITITNPDAACQLSYALIRYAGYGNSTMLSVTGTGAQLFIRNSFLGDSSYGGLSSSVGTTTEMTGCRMSAVYNYPISNYGSLSLTSTSIVGSASAYYVIFATTGSNTIVTGCSIANNSVNYQTLNSSGSLTVDHTTISGNTGGATWAVYSTATATTVTHCRINNNTGGGLYLSGAACRAVADTVVTNTRSGFDIALAPTDFHDNICNGNGAFGYIVPASNVKDVWLSNTAGTNGRGNAIGVYAGTISTPTLWVDEHPYAIHGDLTIADGTSFSLEPGSIFKFDTYTQLIVNGTMVAEGAPNDPIVFTSYRDDAYGGDTNGDGVSVPAAGDWQRISFASADAGTAMSDCVVSYAGQEDIVNGYGDYTCCALRIQGTGSRVALTRCTVRNTFGYVSPSYYTYAIWVSTGATAEASDVIVAGNAFDGVHNDGALTMTGSRVESNGRHGVYSTGSLVVRNSRISGNAGYGIYSSASGSVAVADTCYNNQYGINFAENSQPTEFHDNVSYTNSICDYVVPVSEVDDVWLENQSDATGVIGIRSGSIDTNLQWIDDYVYHVYGNLTVPFNKTLSLEGGTVMKFDTDKNLTVNGTLTAVGTEGDEIVFTSIKDDAYGGNTNGDGVSTGTQGDWQQIQFAGTNDPCTMQHCKVRYAGGAHGTSNAYREAVHVDANAHVTMTDCEIDQTAAGATYNYALAVYSGADLELSNTYVHDNGTPAAGGVGIYVAEAATPIVGCLAARNGAYGFYLAPEIVGEVAARDSLSANGNSNSIAVLGGTITQDDSWPSTYSYVINGGNVTVNPGTTLVVDKGAVVKFNGDRTLEVKGALVAQGDASEKVIFTSYKDDAYGGDTNMDGTNSVPALGDWRQIFFNGASSATDMGWAVVSYGGYGSNPAVRIENCNLNLSECIVHHNLYRGIRVAATGQLGITHSDIYGNTYGLENLNTSHPVDARNCWWGSATGPLHTTSNPSGQGNQVSSYVLFDPWLQGSIDNPWNPLVSPVTSGDFEDVLIFDLDGDPLKDLIAATPSSGFRVFRRAGFETWEEQPSPVTTGQYSGLDRGDVDNDGIADLLACGSAGIRCFRSGGEGSLTEIDAPLAGQSCGDAHLVYLDHDQNVDIVGCSGNNSGIWVFHGDGAGHWSPRVRPTDSGSHNRVQIRDLNNDTWNDIVATSAEYHGIRTWYGAEDGTWTAGATIGDGLPFFGLDLGDIDRNGTYDIAVGSIDTAVGIKVYLNDGHGGWTASTGPTTTGRYYDIKLRDLNDDHRLDMVAANHSGGVNVWLGTSGLFWNYWYYPITQYTFKKVSIDDFTLNGSPDIAAASTFHGVYLWDNLNPGVQQEYFSTTPDVVNFGQVALGNCAHETFQLQNVTADTLRQVVVYTTNPAFQVTQETREVGPFDMMPGEILNLRVTYCPTSAVMENEVAIVHCSAAVTHLRLTGQGVPYIAPVWSIPLQVRNSQGGANNSQTLTFGGGVGATDGRDVQAGEVCLPPPPPSTIFDARFRIDGCEGSLINVHDYYADRDTFTLSWQPGAAGYPMTISWNPATLPEGTFLISDDIPGYTFVDTLNMAAASQVVIPAGMEFITRLAVTTTRLNNFTYNLGQGWNLVSRPISMAQDSLSRLFPGAISAFAWSGGYQQVHQLATGSGYWLNMSAVSHPVHQGGKFTTNRRTFPAGWSLLGAVYDTVLVSQILQNPPNSIISVFKFDGHYEQATNLLAGRGYWIDLSQPCEITIQNPYSKQAAGGADWDLAGHVTEGKDDGAGVPDSPLDHWVLPVTVGNAEDAASDPQTLQLGFDRTATSGVDLWLGEADVPPWPPSNLFESRLALTETNGLYLDLRPSGVNEQTFEINWQAGEAGYPVRLAWDPLGIPAGVTLTLTDNLDGSILRPIDMADISSLVIEEDQSFLTGVRIRALLSPSGVAGTAVPVPFALLPNLPNPFKQSTAIRYSIPRDETVELAVHDVAGRTVRVLVRGQQPAGLHSVIWDGCDESGDAVGAGIYFYRLRAERAVVTRKLIVVR